VSKETLRTKRLLSIILRMLPSLFTIAILVIITRSKGIRGRATAPAALGLPFERKGP
jgi:ABC-type uncharacterized transport system permease subunit